MKSRMRTPFSFGLLGLAALGIAAPMNKTLASSVSAGGGTAAFVLKSGALGLAKGGDVEEISAGAGRRVVMAASSLDGVAYVTRAEQGDPAFRIHLRQGAASQEAAIPAWAIFSKVAWVGRSPVLIGARGGLIYSPAKKAFVDSKEILKGEAGDAFMQCFIVPGENGSWTAVRPWRWIENEGGRSVQSQITMFDAGGERVGAFLTTAPRYKQVGRHTIDDAGRIQGSEFVVAQARLAVGRRDVAALEDQDVSWAPFSRPDWQFVRQKMDGPTALPTDSAVVAAGMVWRLRGASLLAHHPESGVSFAYLPWNAQIGAPTQISASDNKLWVVCERGILELDPSKPSGQTGYGGFIRARLGLFGRAANERENRLMNATISYLGVPYKWGGNDRAGLDCSGLVVQAHLALGIKLPRTSTDLRQTGMGQIVRDELRIGDILTLPGHAAVYVGDGRTIEARTSTQSVAYWNIWNRKDVVVRRFL